jgi:RNA polymerase sigma factor (sigma-70 family)
MAATAVPLRSRRRPPGRSIRRVGDDRLVARVRAGDDVAFEAIYDRYYLGLLAFCRHMLGSRHEAEDALQHAFASAYRALRGGDAVIELRPWLYTIARNRCLSALRSQREEVEVDGRQLDRGSLDGLGAQIQLRAELRELVDDLQRLPDDQRAALVLFELGDQSHEEIASVLGVRREKIKALVFQARAGLLRAREARDASCVDVREQLASVLGTLPSRGMARAHIDRCPGCAAFEHEVRGQRSALAAILPVAPTVGLKTSVLGFALGGGGGAAALTGAGAGGGATVAGGVLAAGGASAGGGGVAGVAGALGTSAAATVAGGLATSSKIAGGVAGATAKGFVAKILAVVAVASGTGEATQLGSHTPLTPPVQSPKATPAAVVKPPPAPLNPLLQHVNSGPAPVVPAPAAPSAPVMQAGVPEPEPAHADALPIAAPAPSSVHIAAPAADAAPAATTPAADPAADSSAAPTTTTTTEADPAPTSTGTPDATTSTTPTSATTTTTTSPPADAGTPDASPPAGTVAPDPGATTTTTSAPADPSSPPPPGPAADAPQVQP